MTITPLSVNTSFIQFAFKVLRSATSRALHTCANRFGYVAGEVFSDRVQKVTVSLFLHLFTISAHTFAEKLVQY